MSKKGKTKIIKCSICGLEFETSYSGGVYDVTSKGGAKL